jgi:hypothetical protein
MAQLDGAGVRIIPMTRVTAIEPGRVTVANIYSGRPWVIDDAETVVLACGSIPYDGLFRALKPLIPEVHILGDAYAPRRVVFATRQAWELARTLE